MTTTPTEPSGEREVELLPCPFCGEKAAWADGEQKQVYGNEQVYCPNCYASTAPDSDKVSAAAWWNDRTPSLGE